MYRAKERGRGRCEMFDIDMRARALERVETEHELRAAIDDRALVVHYQPLVSIATGDVVGVEALVRWAHEKRGLVPPAEFIPVAEELGLIVRLGAFVLEEACQTIAAWNRDNPTQQLNVSVNLSPKQVSSVGLSDTIRATLDASGLDPGMLCLEITETALLEDVAANSANLRALKRLGIHIAVDDFGTGYSSLSYLKRLPVDILKVDRSFTQGVGTDSHDRAIVGAVIDLAHALGLQTVAEGVETREQVETLTALGCDEGQGFHWTPALPADELEQWLRAARGTAVVPTEAMA
jgi:EAL domain-containing protein (putative c-di-GMP-specific phosphodiesterase class I)